MKPAGLDCLYSGEGIAFTLSADYFTTIFLPLMM